MILATSFPEVKKIFSLTNRLACHMLMGRRMKYTRFELGFTRSRKVNALSDAAFRLWVSLIDYSREQLTDGHILPLDLNAIPHFQNENENRKSTINQLIENGLLEPKSDGSWQIHDFLDWQDSAETVKERKEFARERAKSARGSKSKKSDLESSHELFTEYPRISSSLSSDHKSEEIRSEEPDSKPRERTRAEEIRIVFDFWAKEMDHQKAKLGSDRKKRINARLEEGFTVRDLCLAVKGAKNDDWYMGRAPNSNKSYDGIHNLFLNSERVEKFIELSGKKRTSGGKIIQQTAEEAERLKTEHEASVERQRERQRQKLHGSNIQTENISDDTKNNIIDLFSALKGTI